MNLINNQKIVIVLGMHRSGTSALTKSLKLLGVNLGTELHQPRYDNPKGFWEDKDCVAINDALLSYFSSSWDDLYLDDTSNLDTPKVQDLRTQASELLRSRVSSCGLWGFKDPRSSRLIPFWKLVLKDLNCTPLFVIAVRNPLSVAASLTKRDQLPVERSIYLWQQHNLPALTETIGDKRLVVDYDQLLADPLRQISRIAKALDLGMPRADSEKVQAYCKDFLEEGLRHSTFTDKSLKSNPAVSSDVINLYEILTEASTDKISLDSPQIAAAIETLKLNLIRTKPAFSYISSLEKSRAHYKNLLETTQTKYSELTETAANLNQDLTAAKKLSNTLIEEKSYWTANFTKYQAASRTAEQKLSTALKQLDLAERQHKELIVKYSLQAKELESSSRLQVELTRAMGEQKACLSVEIEDLRDNCNNLKQRELDVISKTQTLQNEINQLHQIATEKQLIINQMTNSKSWKLTKPLRGTIELGRSFKNATLTRSRKTVLSAWQKAPISRTTKDKLRDLAFTTAPFIFKNTNRYSNWKSARNVTGQSQDLFKDSSFDESLFVEHTENSAPLNPATRLIAFYLPQFHPIPENNSWWGEGFTEWTNVKPAEPQFEGHYQPRIPGELGYYNLLDGKTQKRQVELAKHYGIGGFCFYMYWFGGKRLLEKPLDNYLDDQSLDLPFCICWANENWSRRWDGLDQEILMSQSHSPEDDIAFITEAAKYLKDPRYIRVENKPLLVIYRPALFPDIKATTIRWRNWCQENGIGEIHLSYTQSFESVDPKEYGFDSAIEFPPNNACPPNLTDSVKPIAGTFSGIVCDWRHYPARSENYPDVDYTLFRSVCPAWDNTARRKNKGTVFINSSPTAYKKWLENAITDTTKRFTEQTKKLIFINAWNEWAEGAYLEPDKRHGYAFLDATRKALTNSSVSKIGSILLTTHDCHKHGAQFLILEMAKKFKQMNITPFVIALDGGDLLNQFLEVGATINANVASAAELSNFIQHAIDAGSTEAIINTVVSAPIIPTLKLHGLKILSLVHEMPQVIKGRGLEANAKLMVDCADLIVFPAESVANGFAEFTYLPPEKKVVRPQGLLRENPYKGRKLDARRAVISKHNLDPACKIILAVGYIDQRKGTDLFVEAAANVLRSEPHAVFIWVGHSEPKLEESLQARVNKLGIANKVIFAGFDSSPFAYYAAADIYALTSREDPFPNVVLESLAVDVPVVAFEGCTGAQDLILKNSGKIAKKENPQSFAECILMLLNADSGKTVETTGSLRQYCLDLLYFLSGKHRVSVIVPNYNYGRYLKDRIDSITGQSYPIYELIILDDASTDASLETLQAIQKNLPIDSQIIINKHNSGSVSAQWAKGLAAAKGDLIWIAEADDNAESNFIEEVAKAFNDPKVGLSYCESKQVDTDGRQIADNYVYYTRQISAGFLSDYCHDGSEEIARALAIKNTIPNVSAVLFRATSLKRALDNCLADMLTLKVAGDWRLYLEILKYNWISHIKQPLNIHRRHVESVTGVLQKELHLSEVQKMQHLAREIVILPQKTADIAQGYLEELATRFGLKVNHSDDTRVSNV